MDAEHHPITAAEFLQTLFGKVADGWLEITCLAPEGVNLYPRTLVMWKQMPLGVIDPSMPGVMKANAKHYSVFFGVTVRNRMYTPEERVSDSGKAYTFYPRGKAHDAQWLTALWIDVDEPGESGYRRCIGSLAVQPSIVVSSGGGWHGYWLLKEPLLLDEHHREMAKRTLKGIAMTAGSDTKVADLARIMRLPGTVNTKPGRDARRCEVVDYLPCYYDYQQFEDAFAPLAAPRIQITRHIPTEASAGLPKWCENYLNTGARPGERNSTAYSAARCLLDNGYSITDMERMISNRALADGLDQREIEALIRSAASAPTGTPNLPTHMATRMSTADRRKAR
mgnify:CR=1 FL=1